MAKDKELQKYSSIMNSEDFSGIIRFINDNEEVKQYQLLKIVSNQYRLKDTLSQMESKGLVIIDHQTKPKIIFRYRLTEKGKQVASKIEEIERLIEP